MLPSTLLRFPLDHGLQHHALLIHTTPTHRGQSLDPRLGVILKALSSNGFSLLLGQASQNWGEIAAESCCAVIWLTKTLLLQTQSLPHSPPPPLQSKINSALSALPQPPLIILADQIPPELNETAQKFFSKSPLIPLSHSPDSQHNQNRLLFRLEQLHKHKDQLCLQKQELEQLHDRERERGRERMEMGKMELEMKFKQRKLKPEQQKQQEIEFEEFQKRQEIEQCLLQKQHEEEMQKLEEVQQNVEDEIVKIIQQIEESIESDFIVRFAANLNRRAKFCLKIRRERMELRDSFANEMNLVAPNLQEFCLFLFDVELNPNKILKYARNLQNEGFETIKDLCHLSYEEGSRMDLRAADVGKIRECAKKKFQEDSGTNESQIFLWSPYWTVDEENEILAENQRKLKEGNEMIQLLKHKTERQLRVIYRERHKIAVLEMKLNEKERELEIAKQNEMSGDGLAERIRLEDIQLPKRPLGELCYRIQNRKDTISWRNYSDEDFGNLNTTVDMDDEEAKNAVTWVYLNVSTMLAEEWKECCSQITLFPNVTLLSAQNQALDEDALKILFDSLKKLPKLQKLWLDENYVTDDCVVLFEDLVTCTKNLQTLSLHINKFSDEGVIKLALCMKNLPSLKLLHLYGENITTEAHTQVRLSLPGVTVWF